MTFEIDDWLTHTPRDILARNFGVNASVFDNLPQVSPSVLTGDISDVKAVSDPNRALQGNSSFVHRVSPADERKVPGGGGTLRIVDSRNFPVAKTIASAIVTLEPKGLRELHWHPNVCETLEIQIDPTFPHCIYIYSNTCPPRAALCLPGSRMALFQIRYRSGYRLHRYRDRPHL